MFKSTFSLIEILRGQELKGKVTAQHCRKSTYPWGSTGAAAMVILRVGGAVVTSRYRRWQQMFGEECFGPWSLENFKFWVCIYIYIHTVYPKVPHESCMNLVDTDVYSILGHPSFMFAITNMANQHASDMASPWMVCQQHCHCNIYMFQIFTGNWTHFCPLQSQSKTNRWTVPTALEYQNMTFNHKVCIFHSNIWDHWHFGSQQIAKDRFEGRWVAPVSIFVMLLEEAPIAVDSFNHPGVELGGPQIYFCSHAHEDHMKGLSKKWRKGPDGMKWPEIFW